MVYLRRPKTKKVRRGGRVLRKKGTSTKRPTKTAEDLDAEMMVGIEIKGRYLHLLKPFFRIMQQVLRTPPQALKKCYKSVSYFMRPLFFQCALL